MKKFFETPEMDICKFAVEDVVTTSVIGGEEDLPFQPFSADSFPIAQ